MLQLPQRLRLDLPDPLARHTELLADFLQLVVGVHADAEAHAENPLFARGERGEDAGGGFAQIRLNGGVRSKRLRQPRLPQNCIRRMTARDADRHGKILICDWAMPDFMAALALADEDTARRFQQVPQRAVELRGHSGCGGFGFAKRRDLQIKRSGVRVRVIVGKKIERHCRHLVQQAVQRRRICGGWNVIAMTSPD